MPRGDGADERPGLGLGQAVGARPGGRGHSGFMCSLDGAGVRFRIEHQIRQSQPGSLRVGGVDEYIGGPRGAAEFRRMAEDDGDPGPHRADQVVNPLLFERGFREGKDLRFFRVEHHHQGRVGIRGRHRSILFLVELDAAVFRSPVVAPIHFFFFTVTVTGAEVVVPPLSSAATAVRTYVPGAGLLHCML